jgi:glycosyltransferase involved in cell wall biosynthesis
MEARDPVKVVCLFPEPTPYRSPLLDRVAARPEIDLTVVYSAQTVARRTWKVEVGHRAVFLRGIPLPGVRPVLRHDYPVVPGVWPLLNRLSPAAVVVSGWSTFASQAGMLWCRRHHIPYIVVVESHDRDVRSGWRRLVKRSIVPRFLAGASGVLVTGTLARESMLRWGVPPERIRVFANTVDVEAFAESARDLEPRRAEVRDAQGIPHDACVALSVCRLVPEKALDVFLEATARVPGLVPVVAGEGPERAALERLAHDLGLPAVFLGDVAWDEIAGLYAAADIFVLLSRHEPWGVVVNEAAACGLPLVLSDTVGAAWDLLRSGENGFVVEPGDVAAAAEALAALATDEARRARAGARSRELASAWGYDASVEAFVEAVLESRDASSRLSTPI